ncbi:Universal stress protein family [Brevundimonas diminuta]|uniref:universal stress protein n=1 Tax=Brevundimonas diminuta TaxID=293 RepID=UPI0002E0DE07|nr:universal stress protein [Brevundimonas diminuta]OWR21788.1 universal stress protein [Brevundimonas diminuta]WQE46534.1 universal stress protein [Brevundimonas diminuta]SPU48009.1 Universal stress protein family [Brevundimonas diminuta]SUW15787.1 Universal stress protein family [Brevundimonas diminuta]
MAEQATSVVVCGIDGSAHAEAAVRVAAQLAQAKGGKLALVAVNPLSSASGHPDIRAWKVEEQEAILTRSTAEARRHCKSVEAVTIEGHDVPDALIAAADQLGADHIVVGTGDRKGLVNWLMGSTAKAVAARAPVSVTIAR